MGFIFLSKMSVLKYHKIASIMFLVITGFKKKKKHLGRICFLMFTASRGQPGFKDSRNKYTLNRRKEIRSLNPSG